MPSKSSSDNAYCITERNLTSLFLKTWRILCLRFFDILSQVSGEYIFPESTFRQAIHEERTESSSLTCELAKDVRGQRLPEYTRRGA